MQAVCLSIGAAIPASYLGLLVSKEKTQVRTEDIQAIAQHVDGGLQCDKTPVGSEIMHSFFVEKSIPGEGVALLASMIWGALVQCHSSHLFVPAEDHPVELHPLPVCIPEDCEATPADNDALIGSPERRHSEELQDHTSTEHVPNTRRFSSSRRRWSRGRTPVQKKWWSASIVGSLRGMPLKFSSLNLPDPNVIEEGDDEEVSLDDQV